MTQTLTIDIANNKKIKNNKVMKYKLLLLILLMKSLKIEYKNMNDSKFYNNSH